MPNESGSVLSAGQSDVVDAAIAGLTAPVKTLPPRLFYDEEGCRLFYEITRLPEYYLTRTETDLLADVAESVVPEGISMGALVEFGGSDETKARYLLKLRNTNGDPVFSTYVPIDVASSALSKMQSRLQVSHPKLRIVPVVADFMQPIRLPEIGRQRFGFFPGSTIGNLDPDAAVRFLRSAHASLGAGSWFLLGADLRKDPSILLPAYNDAAGVTAAFNLNLLRRLNREAAANFDLSGFQHEARWNDSKSRIEMHLVSCRDQSVDVAGVHISFHAGETIHTENSYKHPPEVLIGLARDGGWICERIWTDPAGFLAEFLLRRG